ncbi:hypothetical protein V8F20_011377, partial [Naviculisporaceae sp. PSN 640]
MLEGRPWIYALFLSCDLVFIAHSHAALLSHWLRTRKRDIYLCLGASMRISSTCLPLLTETHNAKPRNGTGQARQDKDICAFLISTRVDDYFRQRGSKV